MLTPAEVADRFKVPRERVYTWIHARRLRAINLGASESHPRWFVTEEDLHEFVNRSRSDWAPPRRKSRMRTRTTEGAEVMRRLCPKAYAKAGDGQDD